MGKISLIILTLIFAYSASGYGAKCALFLGTGSPVILPATTEKTAEGLRHLLTNSEEFRDYLSEHNEYIYKLRRSKALDDALFNKEATIAAVVTNKTDEYIKTEIEAANRTRSHVQALVAKQMEMLSFMKVGSRIPKNLKVHFQNMLDLVVSPYGTKPLYVKEDPEVYFLKRFSAFIDEWIAMLPEDGEVDFEDFMSKLESKKSLRNFFVYELLPKWNIALWTIYDFD